MFSIKSKRFPDERKYSWIGVGALAVGVVGGAISRGKANKKMRNLQAQNEQNKYVTNPEAQKRLGLANTLLNARMPGSAQAERNIYTSGANAIARTQRNAGDSSQALALGQAVQGQEGQQFNDLAMTEAQDYQRRYGNQVGAQQGVINEGDKVQGDKNRVFQDNVAFQGAQAANNANTWQSVSNAGFSLAGFGMQGGFNSGMGQSMWGNRNANPGANNYAMQRTQPYNPQTLPYGNG